MPTNAEILIADANCLACGIPGIDMKLAVLIAIYGQAAGVSLNPETLISNARCLANCIPGTDMKLAVLISLAQNGGGGGGGGITLAQALAYVEANADSFAQTNVGFVSLTLSGGIFMGNTVFLPNGSASFNALDIAVDGSVDINGGNIALNADGSASFAGQIAIGLAAAIIFQADGSASIGNVFIGSTGTITTPQDIEITDTTKGYITKSPNGTRYRIKVDNAGNLGTELA